MGGWKRLTDDALQAARTRAKIMDGLARAERALFTRPTPKSARAQMKFLRTREKGSTKTLAERLGVFRKTVERYLGPPRSRRSASRPLW
ncbi:hypothetical protein OHA79_46495 (plasmid) [Streptomyces sp. NBC_00841]|uniref:hypothetical protein n=1 Tax=unclassified Streptomyces TaxID=2593676 RepID=UPI0022505BF5|nr:MULTISPECIES: hypothetical protein [unclassified Streptomyces]MCX4537882.1 hypothetical protein [Streptomyces sp. NBC_01669]WSA05073.1 hypothetical protein OHA79_46495 [Streptomyces sp. NBC_00841]